MLFSSKTMGRPIFKKPLLYVLACKYVTLIKPSSVAAERFRC